jgi:CRISPR-associated endonuclease/helicase Cas3
MPVFSKVAAEADVEALGLAEKLPTDREGKPWRLSKHQVETYRALTQEDVDVVLNVAMTGDGKSLAAYLPTLTDPANHCLGMYPTNELLRDQERQLRGYLSSFGVTEDQVPLSSLWGAELTRLEERLGMQSRDALLKERFSNASVILTNPDIFNLVMNYSYGQYSPMFTEEELPYTLGVNFDTFVFDEFHVFSVPQIVAALTSMLYFAQQPGLRSKFLFSSATPSDILIEMIDRAGLRYRLVKGEYASGPGDSYRQVLYPVSLEFDKPEPNADAETWVREHVDELVEFWHSCDRQAKGAIIVNSVAMARRIAEFLAGALAPEGISVGENTGLTDQTRRREALTKDIVVGTSTIDVGVDFNINYLIFESTNAGNFLQRLGRLARVRQGEPAFPHYEAHALLSSRTPWIHSRLQEGFRDGETVERTGKFQEVVNGAFPQENSFLPYVKRWGKLLPAHILAVLQRRKDAYADLLTRLKPRYSEAFGLDIEKAQSHYWGLVKHEEKGKRVLDEVLSFRGSSPFQVACWDTSVDPPAFIAYDLFSLVQTADFELVEPGEYESAVKRHVPQEELAAALGQSKYTLGHEGNNPLLVRIRGFWPDRDWLTLSIAEDLSELQDQVKVLHGLRIDKPNNNPQLGSVNTVLKRQNVVCFCTRENIPVLRRKLHLPAMFPLFKICDLYEKEYAITFGKSALLLESVMLRYKNRSAEDAAIIL